MTVGELKELLKDVPDDYKVRLNSDLLFSTYEVDAHVLYVSEKSKTVCLAEVEP